MKRVGTILLSLAALAGCRSSQPTTNPFMRTTVAPPATGQGAVVVQGEPYYPGTVGQTPPTAAPMMSPPTTTVPAPVIAPAPIQPALPNNNQYAPPGGSFQYNQSQLERRPNDAAGDYAWVHDAGQPRASPTARPSSAAHPPEAQAPETLSARPSKPATVAAAPAIGHAPTEALPVQNDSPQLASSPNPSTIRFVESDSKATARTDTASPTLRITAGRAAPSDRVDSHVSRAQWTNPEPTTEAARIARHADPQTASTGPSVARFAKSKAPATSEYSFTPDYGSLRGRLEYTASTRQWKLRYIPIDGQTDTYGGSVVLPASADLDRYTAGQVVEVRGQISTSAPPAGTFSPLYDLEAIRPAGR